MPFDYQGYDRRFVHQGLYLEQLDGETLKVYIAVDTSGSISKDVITEFLSEIYGILSIYPEIKCFLYFADASLYGPYVLNTKEDLPRPKGGGGTSFHPFFNEIRNKNKLIDHCIAVYLTDGFAEYPKIKPDIPVLWVVSSGGIGLEKIPFGESVRLINKYN